VVALLLDPEAVLLLLAAASGWRGLLPNGAAEAGSGAIVSKEFQHAFSIRSSLKPTEVQPPTAAQGTPAVVTLRARLRRALRKGGRIALKGGMRVLNLHSRFLIKSSVLDKRISLAIAFLITFCFGVAAALVWQSSREVVSVPQAAVALSPSLEQQLEAMSSSLAAVRQSVDELSNGSDK
jgi:hypothetical protein